MHFGKFLAVKAPGINNFYYFIVQKKYFSQTVQQHKLIIISM